MASWLECTFPDRAVLVWTLAGDIVLCSWARHFTQTFQTIPGFNSRPLLKGFWRATQVYKWAPANCWRNVTNCGGVTCDGLASHLGGIEILLAASCYRNRDKLQQLWASQLQGFAYGKPCDWATSCLRIIVSYLCGNIGTSSGSTFPDIPPLRSATISTAYKHGTINPLVTSYFT